jgi:hypothetical protein
MKSITVYIFSANNAFAIHTLMMHNNINNKNKTHFTGKITLHVAQTVNTELLQHYIP